MGGTYLGLVYDIVGGEKNLGINKEGGGFWGSKKDDQRPYLTSILSILVFVSSTRPKPARSTSFSRSCRL